MSFFLSNILKKLPLPEIPMGEHALMETVWLLLTSVIMVPLICKLPGGSAVLGFLVRTFAATCLCCLHVCMSGMASQQLTCGHVFSQAYTVFSSMGSECTGIRPHACKHVHVMCCSM